MFQWSSLLTRIHARGGFENPFPLVRAWPVVVDLVQISILLWIASGLMMGWKLRRHRGWGLLALGAGLAAFGVFLAVL